VKNDQIKLSFDLHDFHTYENWSLLRPKIIKFIINVKNDQNKLRNYKTLFVEIGTLFRLYKCYGVVARYDFASVF
jgi:hypothetical protein